MDVFVLEMDNEDASAEDKEKIATSKQELDQYLGAYPYER